MNLHSVKSSAKYILLQSNQECSIWSEVGCSGRMHNAHGGTLHYNSANSSATISEVHWSGGMYTVQKRYIKVQNALEQAAKWVGVGCTQRKSDI